MLEKPTLKTTWMPLGFAVMAMLILNVGLYTRLAPQHTSELLAFPYYADYADPNASESYVSFGGDWEIRDQMLVQMSTSGYDLGTDIPLSIPADQPYRYDVTVRYLDGEHSGGILFNIQQPGTRQKSHMARFNTDGNSWWLIYGYFDDGSAFIGQGSVQLSLTPRDPAPHVMSAQVSGTTYTLLIDGQAVAADVPLFYQGGGVGLITAAAQVGFDDVRVEPFMQTEATPVQPVEVATDAPAPETTNIPDAAVVETSLFGTNFNEDGTGSQWTPISGAWTFEPGAMVQTQAEGFDLSTILNVPFNAPYTLRETFRHRSGTGGGVLFNLPASTGVSGGTMVRYFEDGTIIAWGYFDANGVFNGQGSAQVSAPGAEAHTLEIGVGADTFTVKLDGALVVENAPLNAPNATSYIGATASQSVTAFELVTVSGLASTSAVVSPDSAAIANGINAELAIGNWQIDGSTVTQLSTELTDYFAGTGVAAETFTLSVDIRLPADNAQSGGGIVFHMQGRDDPRGGAMVRFGSGGGEIFWGEYNAEGVFAGVGGAPLTLTAGDPITLAITVRSAAYDLRVNGTLIGENLPITQSQGWIGLISFSGAVTFSNMQITLGNFVTMQAIQTFQRRFAPLRDRITHAIEAINQPEYHWITRPLLAFLITRFIVFLSAYLAEIAIPGVIGDGLYHVNAGNVFLDVWARWDSAFYLRIATDGYFFAPGVQSSVAFFPVYPLLVNLITPLAGSTLAAGVVVSNLCLLGALIFLYRLTELEFDDAGAASRAVFYIAAFPTAFFFTAVYTESTFLMFTIATMYFARRRLWMWAALFGMITSASRIVGVVMWGVVGLEWLRSHGWTLTTIYKPEAWRNLLTGIRRDWVNLLILFAIPLGMVSYMIFLKIQFNDPVAFSTTQSAWGREMLGPLAIVWRDLTGFLRGNFLTGEIWYHVMIDLAAFFAVLAISIAIWRRLGASYALYCMISILIPASSGTGSLSRYALVIFPMFMMLGRWGRYQWLDRLLLISFSVLLGVLTSVFVNWIFVA